MLIPSIDLMNGRVVQLVRGETLAVESDDLGGWIRKFERFPIVQLIDLDAALGKGDNNDLVREICTRLPCQVGGGIRSAERATAVLEAGAQRVIVGSALFDSSSVRITSAEALRAAVGSDRLIAAVDSRDGFVTIHGWKTMTTIKATEAVKVLTPYVGGFLYTHVDTEGTMSGLNVEAVMTVARATPRRLIAAGGIKSMDEVERLDQAGVDAVVGMAIYTGAIVVP